MMRKLISNVILGLAILAVAATSSCKCAAERRAVVEVEDTQKIIVEGWLSYTDADTTLDAAKKDDRRKLVESLHRLMESLKNSLK